MSQTKQIKQLSHTKAFQAGFFEASSTLEFMAKAFSWTIPFLATICLAVLLSIPQWQVVLTTEAITGLYLPRSATRQYSPRPGTPRCGRSIAPAGRAGSGWQRPWRLYHSTPPLTCALVDSEVCGDSVDMSSLSALIPTEPGTRPTLAKYCSHYSVSKY